MKTLNAKKRISKAIFSLLLLIGNFNIVNGAPVISSFSPASGPIGTTVTIKGSGFNPIINDNIVFFGATKASISAVNDTSITVSVPLGATYQYISVTNLSNQLTAFSLQPFRVTFSGNIDFTGNNDVYIGLQPNAVAVGDLDGDGKPEMVVVDWAGDSVEIFHNTSTPGNVSFAASINLPAGSSPSSVSIGDIDGDGKPDLVVTNFFSNTVYVYRNTFNDTLGIISFAPPLGFSTGVYPNSVCIGDLNGDGKADLAVSNNGSSNLSVLVNTSTRSNINFAQQDTFTTGLNPFSINMGDIDGDGKPDLVIANSGTTTVSVLRNTSASGTLSLAPQVAFETGTYGPTTISIGDIDGDGKPDLALSGAMVSILRNTSTPGNVSLYWVDTLPAQISPVSICVTDIDGDGKPDLAVVNQSSDNVSVFHNTSTPGAFNFSTQDTFTTGAGPIFIRIADMDGDGKPDLVIANNNSNTASILLQNSSNCVAPVSYTDFDDSTLSLYPWQGVKVSFLTADCNLNDTVMSDLLTVFDSVWNYYKGVTGIEPIHWPATYLDGRNTIAEVPATCGAACSYIGYTGNEMQTNYFNVLYDSVLQVDKYDQALFYEFGRTFWFFGNQIEYKDSSQPITTGYAVFMRFMAMNATGVKPAYFNTTPFDTFENDEINLFNLYMANPAYTWATTLGANKAPINPLGLGATDLFSSFLFELMKLYGGNNFVNNIWKQVALRPAAVTTQGAVDNFILAACAAANQNITCRFQNWRWPISDSALIEATQLYGSGIPQTTVINDTVCAGSVIYFYNDTITQSGSYWSDTLMASSGCDSFALLHVTVLAPLVINDSITNASSPTSDNGVISLTVTGGLAPYNYNWSGGGSSAGLQNLATGNYFVTVVDAEGCSAFKSFSVGSNSNVSGPTFCMDTVSGSYGQTVIITVKANNFAKLITAQGSIAFNPAILKYTGLQQFGISTLNAANFGTTNASTGTIDFSWSDPTLNGVTLANGTVVFAMTFEVIGAAGQASSVAFTDTPLTLQFADTSLNVVNAIFLPGLVKDILPLTFNSLVLPVSCNGGANGEIIVLPSGGIPPYTLKVNGKVVATDTISTSDTIKNLTEGYYFISVTDNSLTTVTDSVLVNQPAAISIAISGQNVLCAGESNGQARAIVSGGNSPFTWSWSGGSDSYMATGLAAGTYYLTVHDALLCIAIDSVKITQPAPLVISGKVQNASSPTADNGNISLTVTGGTTPYSYQITNNSSGSTLPAAPSTTVGAGVYTLTVTDKNGCSATKTFDVLANATLSGRIHDILGAGVRTVTVALNGTSKSALSTDTSGTYSFTVLAGSADTITPSKNNDTLITNGVSTLDVLEVQRYLLGTYTFSTPYNIIAADVDNSGSVSTLDIAYMRELILGRIKFFPGNRLWAFVPAAHTFSNPQKPFPFPGNLIISSASPLTGQDFVGIKLGDVSDTWNPKEAKTEAATDTVKLIIPNVQVSADTSFQVPVTVQNFSRIAGFQFTLQWDSTKLTFDSLFSLAGSADSVITQNLVYCDTTRNDSGLINSGTLTVQWTDPDGTSKNISNDSALFYLQFKVNATGNSNSQIVIDSAITGIQFIDTNLNILNYELSNGQVVIVDGINAITDDEMHLSIAPNPFNEHTSLFFELSAAQKAEIKVYNSLGQLVQQKQAIYNAGKNREDIDALAPGVYMVNFNAGNVNRTLRVVEIEK